MKVWTVHTAPGAPSPAADSTSRPPGSVPSVGEPPPAAAAPAVPRRASRPPLVLVREGFAWAAFVFNILWLLWHRLWLAGLAYLVLALALGTLLPEGLGLPAGLALQFLLGAHGNDLRRRALARRGYAMAGVVTERDEDAALSRLLVQRPDLAAPVARAALA